ncbi:MAG: MGMT family protein [Desulfuromonadaceae bacterium]|nr:MGMT family protein [Desulfuromonadaceae bacterium]
MSYCSYFTTCYGYGAVYATDQGVVTVEIPNLSGRENTKSLKPVDCKQSDVTRRTALLLQRYFQGEQVGFGAIPVVFEGISPFRRHVLEVVRALRYGQICSYGQVAQACGSPRAARAVGGALAANSVPIIIPCHRVVAENGRLTGFSAPGGEQTKRELLKIEGVEFKGLLAVPTQVVIHKVP